MRLSTHLIRIAAGALALASCAVPASAAPVAQAQQAAAEALLPTVIAVRGAVQQVVAPQSQAASSRRGAVSPAAVALIIRWEISSPTVYERRYRWPIWPGGASGVTWGVGYDGGHQTPLTITRDWAAHPEVDRLQSTSGVTGRAARPLASGMRDVITPFAHAETVFTQSTLPVYQARTARAFREGWDSLPPDAQGALVSVVYNRGASMAGSRNTEKRVIRDRCVPAADTACIAVQIRAMCRLWVGTPNGDGLCNRRGAEARLAERAS